MASDTQYKTLLSKYNVAVARCRDLEEQNFSSTRHWKAEEERFKVIDDAARKLCESILAKDRSEMVLGEQNLWYSTPTDTLLQRATKSYRQYNQETTNILNKIQAESERRRSKIESLEDQIRQFMAGNLTEFEAVQEPAPPKSEQPQKSPEYLGTPKAVKNAADSGKIELIIEEKGDVEVDGEMEDIAEMIGISEQTKLTVSAVPIRDSAAKAKRITDKKEDAIMAHMVDLKDFEARCDDNMWRILEIIGKEGLSKYPDIKNRALEYGVGVKKTQLHYATNQLYRMKALTQEILNLPLTPKIMIYNLSDIGIRLFRKKFGIAPVESEAERVRKEHDNLNHGYGILDLEKILIESKRYKEVFVFNRSRAKSVGGGLQYVADIIGIPVAGKYTEYFEYERGFTKQPDFNAKCNKMTQVTRFLNFIAPNKETLIKRLRPQIDEWIATRGQESLRTLKVRVTTPQELRSPSNDDVWLITYDLSKGTAPIKDLTKKE